MKRMTAAIAIVSTMCFAGATASAQTTHDVNVGPGFAFSPADITINVGDTVRWTWVSGFHNVESGVGGSHDGAFRSGDATSVVGTTYQVTFDSAFLAANPMAGDVYNYYCVIHFGGGMVGSVTVIGCPGDLDGDNDIDLSDLAAMLSNYGTTSGATYQDGDLDFDGDVDLADLAALLSVYGTNC